MKNYQLCIELLTDTTFGRGDGVAGLVDEEVQFDEWGCPFLGGKAIKGILVNECADILSALSKSTNKKAADDAAKRLFGAPGSSLEDNAILAIGPAQLPEGVRKYFAIHQVPMEDILGAFTDIRWQTALEDTGETKEHTLRTIRVILRKTTFIAELTFLNDPNPTELGLLVACIKAFRRAGTGRNRGKGRLEAKICGGDENEFVAAYDHFKKECMQ